MNANPETLIDDGELVRRAICGMEYQISAHREFVSAGVFMWYPVIRTRLSKDDSMNPWGRWHEIRGFYQRVPGGFKNPDHAINYGIGMMNGEIE